MARMVFNLKHTSTIVESASIFNKHEPEGAVVLSANLGVTGGLAVFGVRRRPAAKAVARPTSEFQR